MRGRVQGPGALGYTSLVPLCSALFLVQELLEMEDKAALNSRSRSLCLDPQVTRKDSMTQPNGKTSPKRRYAWGLALLLCLPCSWVARQGTQAGPRATALQTWP